MKYLVLALAVLVTTKVSAQGLMINAAEVGVGKFHRYDAAQHPKEYMNNVWADYEMPVNAPLKTPVVFETAPNKITIQFSTLEELLNAMVTVSKTKGQKIAVLNLNGHGMPGGMWFPKDEKEKESSACASWRNAAEAPDVQNYNQYYEPVPLSAILTIRVSANVTNAHYGCVTGSDSWKEVAATIPDLKTYFTDDAQVHFESCTVGRGKAGEAFAATVASLLLTGHNATVQTLIPLGLGDWSMPEGMGFWDYQSFAQLNRDNKRYPVNKKDSEMAQKGTVRVTGFVAGKWTSQEIGNLDIMHVGFEPPPAATISMNGGDLSLEDDELNNSSFEAPLQVPIIGTGASVTLIQ